MLAPPEVLLETERAARESQGGGRETPGWGGSHVWQALAVAGAQQILAGLMGGKWSS